MSMTVTMDASSFARVAALMEREPVRIERELRTLVQRRAGLAKAALARATPTGQRDPQDPDAGRPHMRDLWHQDTTGPMEAVVFNDAAYSPWLFSGTQSHWVAPVQAEALRFFEGGHPVFSKGHEVSGITPNPKLLRALDSQMLKAEADLFDYGIRATRQMAGLIP